MMDQTIIRVSETKWIVLDDEGNRFVHGGTGYEHLQVGESEPYYNTALASRKAAGVSGWGWGARPRRSW